MLVFIVVVYGVVAVVLYVVYVVVVVYAYVVVAVVLGVAVIYHFPESVPKLVAIAASKEIGKFIENPYVTS